MLLVNNCLRSGSVPLKSKLAWPGLGFSIEFNYCGGIFGKMAKTCMKITKSTFWGQSSGGDQSIFSVSGLSESPPVPQLGETQLCVQRVYEVKIKMVQEQWLQLKMKFLLGFNMEIIA